MTNVVVLDLGIGNLANLVRALRYVGARPIVASDPHQVERASHLILPGVGAFRPPRERLRGALEEPLRRAVSRGTPLLGICVGFQLLFEESEEGGRTDGLGLLRGRVTRLPAVVPVPQIGWNYVEPVRPHGLFEGLQMPQYFYFVHSYAPEAIDTDAVVATTRHGRPFPAVLARGSVAGVQFHPERSGAAGLRLLENFLRRGGPWS